MALIRKTLEELRANPYKMTDAERQRILSMTEEEIEAAALADLDNPPWTDQELADARCERDERLAKEKQRA